MPPRMPIQHEQVIIEAYLSGLSAKNAGAKFGYSKAACLNVLRRNNIERRSTSIPLEHEQAIIEAYLNHATAKQAAALFGYDKATCLNVLKRNNIDARSSSEALRHYAVDESFFDVIDTEEKAYWLGFLTADGAVKSDKISLSLKATDIGHLHKFANSLSSKHPVFLTVQTQGYIQGKPYSCIHISSLRLVNALKRLGVVPNKSLIVQPCQQVPENHMAAYWRGVFDGDGFISYNSLCSPYWQIGQLGTFGIVTGFANFVGQFVESKATIRPKKTIFVVQYGGLALPRAIIKVLYSNATIYLDRKNELAQQLLAQPDHLKRKKSIEKQLLLD